MNTRTACLLLALARREHAGPLTLRMSTPASSSCRRTSAKGLPGAPQHVTLFGDPSQPGLYVDRIKFPPGMKVMPHWHPDTVRTVLVMSGTFYFAVGEQWDESKLKPYPAGVVFRTRENAALCMGQGRRSDGRSARLGRPATRRFHRSNDRVPGACTL